MTLNSQQIGAWVLRILGLAAVVLAAIPPDSVPMAVRPALAVAGALVLAVDRYVTDPSTGSPPAPSPPKKSTFSGQ
jgi:hypothetical protein